MIVDRCDPMRAAAIHDRDPGADADPEQLASLLETRGTPIKFP